MERGGGSVPKIPEDFSITNKQITEYPTPQKTAELYAAAQINRQFYHKIIVSRYYHPEKNTAIKFGLALYRDEAAFFTLMESAGYTSSSSGKFYFVILFCVCEKLYNFIKVTTLLDSIGERILN